MTTKTIHRGTTRTLSGSLAAGDILNIQGGGADGGAGGTALVATDATNAGTIMILAGSKSTVDGQPPGAGGMLAVSGTLTDMGSILVSASRGLYRSSVVAAGEAGTLAVSGTLAVQQAGRVVLSGGAGETEQVPAGMGALFNNTGTVSNAGRVELRGGGAGLYHYATGGLGAVLSNSGTFDNSGSLLVLGGSSAYGSNIRFGAQVDDGGVMTNSGQIFVGGGNSATYLEFGGAGGTLTVGGALTNTSTITLAGGEGANGYADNSGDGGVLLNEGMLANAGLITINAGGAGYTATGTGGTLTSTGLLTNSGTIFVQGATSHGQYDGFTRGYLNLTGPDQSAMVNLGLVSVGGGGGDNGFGSPREGGGVLVDDASLTNQGTILVGGGLAATGAYGSGGLGGLLSITRTFTNQGSIVVAGGAGASTINYFASAAGSGGTISLAQGYFFNSGSLLLEGGTAGQEGGAGGGGAELDVGRLMFLKTGGTLTVGASEGGASALVSIHGEIQADLGSLIENDGRMVFSQGAIIQSGTLHNAGVITGGADLSYLTLINDGLIDAGSTMMAVEGNQVSSTTGHGTFEVGTGGLLIFGGGSIVDDSQTVVLENATALVQVQAQTAGLSIDSALGGSLDIVGGGVARLNAGDTNLNIFIIGPGNLTLSRMSMIDATGSTGADKITALSFGQTLTGGLGADLLTGAAATGDLFRDVAAGLNGDTIASFAGTDAIDITDLAPGPNLMLAYTQNGATGLLTVSEGSTSTTITLQGQFSTASFTTGSDLHGGVLIGLHG